MRMMPVSPRGNSVARVVHDHHLDTGQRPPDGVQQHLRGITGLGAGHRRRLGARVADDDRRTEAGAHLLRELGRHRCRTGGREPQRRQVGVREPRQVDELRPLRRDALAARDALLHHEVEHRLRRPDARQEHAGDDERELVPELVHVPRVRERDRHRSAVERRAEDSAHLCRRLERAVVEPGALRRARGTARPHDARRILGLSVGKPGERAVLRRGALHLGALHDHGRPRHAGRHRVTRRLVDQHRGLALGEDRGDLRRAEPGVDARGDGAQSARGRVPHREVDRRRQVQRHHVSRSHPALGQRHRERVGPAYPLAEGHALVALDVRDRIRERAGDLAEELAERGALELRLPELRLLGQRFSTSMPLLSASQVFGPTPSSRSWPFRIFFMSLRGNSSRISM